MVVKVARGELVKWPDLGLYIPKAVRRLTTRSHEASMPRNSVLYLSLWNLTVTSPQQQQCYRNACENSEQYDHYNIQSRGVETSRDVAMRGLTALGVEALQMFTSIKSDRRWLVTGIVVRLLPISCKMNPPKTVLCESNLLIIVSRGTTTNITNIWTMISWVTGYKT